MRCYGDAATAARIGLGYRTMTDPKTKILVVDDDLRLRDLLQRYLTEQGFGVHTVSDAAGMDKLLGRERVDLLVLDLMLPGEDGLSICRRLRGGKNTVPIIMLTAKGEDVDRIVGLEMGADDYPPEPFKPRALVARILPTSRPCGGSATFSCPTAGSNEVDGFVAPLAPVAHFHPARSPGRGYHGRLARDLPQL